MNMRERKRIFTLERRRDYLANRIANYVGTNDSRDKAEYSALCWILEEFKKLRGDAGGVSGEGSTPSPAEV